MGLQDRDYYREEKYKRDNIYGNLETNRQGKTKQNETHPLYFVLLAFIIIWFVVSKTKFPNRASNAEPVAVKNKIINSSLIPGGLIVYADRQGHYRGTLKVNNISAPFLIDTGATMVTIPRNVAFLAGLKMGSPILVNTAGGDVIDYSSTVDRLTIGSAVIYNVPVTINQHVKEILIGVDLMKHFKITHNSDSIALAIDDRFGFKNMKLFDPRVSEFNEKNSTTTVTGAPLYSVPNQISVENTKVRATWTKTKICDKDGHCKTSYH